MNKHSIEYLKENGIDIDASIELLGDIETYDDILNTFISESDVRIKRIEKNKSEGNMSDYSIDLHSIKSDSKYLGFKKLAEIAYDHELQSKDNNLDYIKEHYQDFINEYNSIMNIVKIYMEG